MANKVNMCSDQLLGVIMRNRADIGVKLQSKHDVRSWHAPGTSGVIFFLGLSLTTHFVMVTSRKPIWNCSGCYETIST